jgi:nucleoside-diphosphate-sugar epimerase
VFVAGATGALGRPLVGALLDAGHAVTGTTRSEAKARALRERGADAAVLDARDAEAVRAAVTAAAPDVVVHQLTAIPENFSPRKYAEAFEPTNRLRAQATPILIDAARAAGARRIVVESISFIVRPQGPWIADEDAPVYTDAPEPMTRTFQTVAAMERSVLEAGGIEGVVLRYGFLYGPGTQIAPGGALAQMVARRQFPVVGKGTGQWSFVHVDDAAAATVLALDHGSPGIYNVTDDEPAAVREWLPVAAAAMGAKPPRRVPAFLARLAAGPVATYTAIEQRGASNAKARRELGWQPRHASWREGFRAVFAQPA